VPDSAVAVGVVGVVGFVGVPGPAESLLLLLPPPQAATPIAKARAPIQRSGRATREEVEWIREVIARVPFG
jgi:hypothetical protein